MSRFYRAIFIALLLMIGMMPVISFASFEKSFASVGSSLFSAIGASVDTTAVTITKTQAALQASLARGRDTITKQISKTKNQILKLQTKTQNLASSIQHSMLKIPNKIMHFTANVTRGFKELLSQKEELVFTKKQETRSLASLRAGGNTSPSRETSDVFPPRSLRGSSTSDVGLETIRYAQNAENQPIKIIERIIVKERSTQHVSGSTQTNETNSVLRAANSVMQDPRINSLITHLADLTTRVDERYGLSQGGGAYSNSALFNIIAQSQRIKTLDDVKITNATIEGYASSKSVSDSYLPLAGGTLTGGLTGTTLTLSGLSCFKQAHLAG